MPSHSRNFSFDSTTSTLHTEGSSAKEEDLSAREKWKLENEPDYLESSTTTLLNSISDQTYNSQVKRGRETKEDEWNLIPEYSKPDVFLVDWTENDMENPRNWEKKRKLKVAIIGIMFTGIVSASISSYSISLDTVISEFQTTELIASLGIVIFSISISTFPLLTAPLSELFGRNIFYSLSAGLFAVLFIPQALATNIPTLLISRLLSGCLASTGLSLVPGTLVDVFSKDEIGLPMSVYSFVSFAATGLAPVLLGFLAEKFDFRINMYLMLGLSTIFFIVVYFFMEETRASVLLTRRAQLIRMETSDHRFRSKAELKHSQTTFGATLKTSLKRPLTMLISEPILYSFTIWITWIWLVLYIGLSGIPIVFGVVYKFSLGDAGLVFGTEIIGSTVGLVIDLKAQKWHRGLPEERLYPALIGSFFVPLGSWIYAWTSFQSIHWIVPQIGLTILYAGLLLVYSSCFTYLSDCYGIYAGSALSAQSFVRTGVGALAPLFTSRMYAALGIHVAGTIAASVGTVLIVIPFLLFSRGAHLRAQSKFTSEEMEDD